MSGSQKHSFHLSFSLKSERKCKKKEEERHRRVQRETSHLNIWTLNSARECSALSTTRREGEAASRIRGNGSEKGSAVCSSRTTPAEWHWADRRPEEKLYQAGWQSHPVPLFTARHVCPSVYPPSPQAAGSLLWACVSQRWAAGARANLIFNPRRLLS